MLPTSSRERSIWFGEDEPPWSELAPGLYPTLERAQLWGRDTSRLSEIGPPDLATLHPSILARAPLMAVRLSSFVVVVVASVVIERGVVRSGSSPHAHPREDDEGLESRAHSEKSQALVAHPIGLSEDLPAILSSSCPVPILRDDIARPQNRVAMLSDKAA